MGTKKFVPILIFSNNLKIVKNPTADNSFQIMTDLFDTIFAGNSF